MTAGSEELARSSRAGGAKANMPGRLRCARNSDITKKLED